MSRTTARHYWTVRDHWAAPKERRPFSGTDPAAGPDRTSTRSYSLGSGVVQIGGKTVGTIERFGFTRPPMKADAESLLAYYRAFFSSMARYHGSYDDQPPIARRPRARIDMSRFDLDLAKFNERENLDRWAAQIAKVMDPKE